MATSEFQDKQFRATLKDLEKFRRGYENTIGRFLRRNAEARMFSMRALEAMREIVRTGHAPAVEIAQAFMGKHEALGAKWTREDKDEFWLASEIE